jgi:arabinofuranan 3-O-arabinosyltransferase
VLVVPESINPGWTARLADGTVLTPVTVNGWQQGWVVPVGSSGPVAIVFASNTPYRIGLFGGLALLPILAALAFWPVRRPSADGEPARPRQLGPAPAALAVAVAGFVVSGVVGVVVMGLALAVRYVLRTRPTLCERVTVGVTAGGLILAGAALSRDPWRSVDGYVGHDWTLQLLALLSVAMLAATLVPLRRSVPNID